MTQEDWTKMNKESHYNSLIKQDLENRKLIKKLQLERDELKKQLKLYGVVGSLPASKEEALSKRKILADKYYRNDSCESAFALGFINCYEWLEIIIKK